MRTLVPATVMVIAAAFAVAASDRQPTADAVYRAYAGGDDLAVQRWLDKLPISESPLVTLPEVRTGAPWSPVAAAFMLEVAVANPSSAHAVSALTRGRTMVVDRPTPLGVNSAEDRFEVLWHQAALGIAQHHHAVATQDDYLLAVEPRFEAAKRRGVRLVSRLPLARAMVAAAKCCDGQGRATPRRSSSGQLLELPTLDTAVEYFDLAAEQEDLRAEALIRSAKLLHDAGQHAAAAERFRQVPPDVPPTLMYVHHLTHARVLDTLDRPAEAIAEYERALAALPTGQLAGIGLAAAYLRFGRTADAARMADAARRMPPLPGRGFLEFDGADFRLVGGWLNEIRGLRR